MDVCGNIKKIENMWERNSQCKTLQDIVEYEIQNGLLEQPNSATDALLWLKR